jgi:hypothetical protein
MNLIKIKFHSVVDVITNSSTVIYTYQDSVIQAKELVQELLELTGKTYLKPDNIFYYGVFCGKDTYLDRRDHDEDDEFFDPDKSKKESANSNPHGPIPENDD